MARAGRVGSKAGMVVKRGAGGRFMGSVGKGGGTDVGGVKLSTSKGRIQMRGSGLSLGQLRKEFGQAVGYNAQFGLHKSYAQKPMAASSVVRSAKREAHYQPQHARTLAIVSAVSTRAYSRVYKKMPA